MNKTLLVCLFLALAAVSTVNAKHPLPEYNAEILATPKVLYSGATEALCESILTAAVASPVPYYVSTVVSTPYISVPATVAVPTTWSYPVVVPASVVSSVPST
jgi:hypothetical protein